MGQRTWFKIYAKQWLRGSIREEPPAIRGIWVDLLALAANGEYGDIGTIQLAEDVGFTDKQIIKILNISEGQWFEAKNCLVNSERIAVHNDSDVIKILNWSKYQSEYERQKPHRNQEFMELRETIKKRDNFTCQKCQKNKDELKVPLCVHHIDNNPSNNIPENLVTLCMSCHSHLSRQESPNPPKQQESSTKRFNKKVQQKGSMGEERIEKDLEKREKRKEKEIRSKDSLPQISISDVLKLYNQICIKLPKAQKLTKNRREKIAIRLKENPEQSFWEHVFNKANETPFLCGKNKNNWTATLDWLITNDTNMIKVIEGSYDSKKHSGLKEFYEEMEAKQNGAEGL